MTRILALLAALAVIIVALRPRKSPAVTSWNEPEDGVQPADPYPASLLR